MYDCGDSLVEYSDREAATDWPEGFKFAQQSPGRSPLVAEIEASAWTVAIQAVTNTRQTPHLRCRRAHGELILRGIHGSAHRRREPAQPGHCCTAESAGHSPCLGAMLALGAARTATESAAAVASGPQAQAKAQRESNVRAKTGGPTPADRERASDVADTAAKTTGAGAGAAFLALIASLIGALAASRVSAGKRMTSGLRHGRSDRQIIPERRDEATILPARA